VRTHACKTMPRARHSMSLLPCVPSPSPSPRSLAPLFSALQLPGPSVGTSVHGTSHVNTCETSCLQAPAITRDIPPRPCMDAAWSRIIVYSQSVKLCLSVRGAVGPHAAACTLRGGKAGLRDAEKCSVCTKAPAASFCRMAAPSVARWTYAGLQASLQDCHPAAQTSAYGAEPPSLPVDAVGDVCGMAAASRRA